VKTECSFGVAVVFRRGENTGRGFGGESVTGGVLGSVSFGVELLGLCLGGSSSLCFICLMRMDSGRSSLTACGEPLREKRAFHAACLDARFGEWTFTGRGQLGTFGLGCCFFPILVVNIVTGRESVDRNTGPILEKSSSALSGSLFCTL